MSQPGGQRGRMRRAEERRRGKNIKNTLSKEVWVAALISLIFTSPHIWIWIISHPCKRLRLCFRAQRRLCGISCSLRDANTEIVTGKKNLSTTGADRKCCQSQLVSRAFMKNWETVQRKTMYNMCGIYMDTHINTLTNIYNSLWHWTTTKTHRGFFFF